MLDFNVVFTLSTQRMTYGRIQYGNRSPPLTAPPRPLRSIRQIFVSEGRGFCAKCYPRPNYPQWGGGGLGLTVDRPTHYSFKILFGASSQARSGIVTTIWRRGLSPRATTQEYSLSIVSGRLELRREFFSIKQKFCLSPGFLDYSFLTDLNIKNGKNMELCRRK